MYQPTFRESSVNNVVMIPLLSENYGCKSESITSFEIFVKLIRQVSNKTCTMVETSSSLSSFVKLDRFLRSKHFFRDYFNYNRNYYAFFDGTRESESQTTIQILVPNSQMTRPGDWSYHSTPLKSHDWNSGCQRMFFRDGRVSNAFTYSYVDYMDFVDLYTHKETMAIVGVLNIKDCQTMEDLHLAERELVVLARHLSEISRNSQRRRVGNDVEFVNNTKIYDNNDNIKMDDNVKNETNPNISFRDIVTRMFIFDSFEESVSKRGIDITHLHLLQSDEVVAFPPSHDKINDKEYKIMEFHLDFVINNLAVAIFLAHEARIEVCDELNDQNNLNYSSNKWINFNVNMGNKRGQKSNSTPYTNPIVIDKEHPSGPSGSLDILELTSIIGALNEINRNVCNNNSEINMGLITGGSVVSTTKTTFSKSGMGGFEENVQDFSEYSNTVTKIRFRQKAKVIATNAVNAFKNKNNHHGSYLLPSSLKYKKLSIPLDINNETMLSSVTTSRYSQKEIDFFTRMSVARRVKYTADLALLAGSPVDAYERYIRAVQLNKNNSDFLWCAASLEGVVAAFVAMADIGGRIADTYLDKEFQYPDNVMLIALSDQMDGIEKVAEYSKLQKSKTTMPVIIHSLIEEACSILTRNVRFCYVYTELLLKLAWYMAELEDIHLHCWWGLGCYTGEDSIMRWECTTVGRLIGLQYLAEKAGIEVILGGASVERCHNFIDVLQRAMTNSCLNLETRAKVASISSKMCIRGILVTKFRNNKGNDSVICHRMPLPRKAAFFATIAAEAISFCRIFSIKYCAHSWLNILNLYCKYANKYDWNGHSSYAWATLRATVFHALSQNAVSSLAEIATEKLLMLLFEIPLENENISLGNFKIKFTNNRTYLGTKGNTTLSNTLIDPFDVKGMTSKRETMNGKGYNSIINLRNPFFLQTTSPIVLSQSKLLDDEPIKMIPLPLIEPKVLLSLARNNSGSMAIIKTLFRKCSVSMSPISLHGVILKTSFNKCLEAQKKSIEYLCEVRRVMAITSITNFYRSLKKNKTDKIFKSLALASALTPVQIIFANILRSESHLLLERVNITRFVEKTQASGTTFFNPYANKSIGGNKNNKVITLVAEGEERIIEIRFSNKCLVPLEISSCQLEFYSEGAVNTQAPPISFVIPPKSETCVVKFPFIVITTDKEKRVFDCATTVKTGGSMTTQTDKYLHDTLFEFVGLRVSCLNRFYFLPFGSTADIASDQVSEFERFEKIGMIPFASSIYSRGLKLFKPGNANRHISFHMESVPSQPYLQISFRKSETPLEDAAVIPVRLSDGEIYTTPPFYLNNYVGQTGLGKLERIQIVSVGKEGFPVQTLFDSDEKSTSVKNEEDVFWDSKDNDYIQNNFDNMIKLESLLFMKMKCLAHNFCLKEMNKKTKTFSESNVIAFQMTLVHGMDGQLADEGKIRVRFLYHGQSPHPCFKYWRKREITLHFVRVKGPRISSLKFRPDLILHNACTELIYSNVQQRYQWHEVSNGETNNDKNMNFCFNVTRKGRKYIVEEDGDSSLNISSMYKVGKEEAVYVADSKIFLLIAVENESNSAIILSNRQRVIGAYQYCRTLTIRVSSGGIVQIPVVIPRIDKISEKGEIIDVASEFSWRISLSWETETRGVNKKGINNGRQGVLRIPSPHINEIIKLHNIFLSNICKPPVSIDVNIGISSNVKCGKMKLYPGSSLDVFVQLYTQVWKPDKTMYNLSIIVNFFCKRKDSAKNIDTFECDYNASYIWCGKQRQKVNNETCGLKLCSKVCFLKPGIFIILAFAEIYNDDRGIHEIWWAPHAEVVKVENSLSHKYNQIVP